MLTRLKVDGFKNLVNVDIRFGPFTCIAGANGVGKSNLFDAIQFLGALADNTILEAASSVRKSAGGSAADIRDLFHRVGNRYDNQMTFEAEMIIPPEGIDDLGQKAEASITFLRYKLILGYRARVNEPLSGPLEILREELTHLKRGEAARHLRFPHAVSSWRNSVLRGARRSPFISTDEEGEQRTIKLHQDGGGSRGRPQSYLASSLPRTVLSTANASESPTALIARREMQSWQLLQLEPSALREPDDFITQPGLGANGSRLPATLHHLARSLPQTDGGHSPMWLYEQVAGRLSELIDDVYAINIDRDEKRQLFTLQVMDKAKTVYPARSLSDGALRFLALAVLEMDPNASGLICLEEPENGIHPKRIPAMLRLLKDIAVDTGEPVGLDNPLRQVIVNTHSPVVVSQVEDDDLLVAELKEMTRGGQRFKGVQFSWLPDTWRASAEPGRHPIARGKVMAYLKHVVDFGNAASHPRANGRKRPFRVSDRPDLQSRLPLNELK